MTVWAGVSPVLAAARLLLILNALLWLAFAATSMGRASTPPVIAALMLGNATLMLLAGIGIGLRRRAI